jgi:hypothetical protein
MNKHREVLNEYDGHEHFLLISIEELQLWNTSATGQPCCLLLPYIITSYCDRHGSVASSKTKATQNNDIDT